MSRLESTTPDQLPELIATFLLEHRVDRPLRVAVDGPAIAAPVELADAVAQALRGAGRAASVIDATAFWRDASLRLEYGRTDVDSYAHDWLDRPALIREVLAPLGPGGNREFLTALRNPVTNRSRHEPYRTAATDEVVVVAGELLLGAGLDFDVAVHLAVSPAARTRRTPPSAAWTLPAHDRYDDDVDPGAVADIVVSWNDPQRPAVRIGRDRRSPAEN